MGRDLSLTRVAGSHKSAAPAISFAASSTPCATQSPCLLSDPSKGLRAAVAAAVLRYCCRLFLPACIAAPLPTSPTLEPLHEPTPPPATISRRCSVSSPTFGGPRRPGFPAATLAVPFPPSTAVTPLPRPFPPLLASLLVGDGVPMEALARSGSAAAAAAAGHARGPPAGGELARLDPALPHHLTHHVVDRSLQGDDLGVQQLAGEGSLRRRQWRRR